MAGNVKRLVFGYAQKYCEAGQMYAVV